MSEIVVFITTPTKEEGEKIGRLMVEKRLAACANILSSVTSFFAWEGKICREEESLVILKSRQALFERLSEAVKKHHSYSVPEIIALPLVAGSADYLKWIQDNTL
ncbi:MAG: divalent-cation tolerance protein CutA [Nitrospiria bacterium]